VERRARTQRQPASFEMPKKKKVVYIGFWHIEFATWLSFFHAARPVMCMWSWCVVWCMYKFK
jgi:hypothetical protein